LFRRDPKRRSPGYPARRKNGEAGLPRPSNGSPAGAVNLRVDGSRSDRFVLYVEGARDREILAGWSRHLAPLFGRRLGRHTVILGGRQPARAIEDFRRRGGAEAGYAGLVVLDRDDHPDHAAAEHLLEPGLELFVWSLRHIESYLLVPAAIRRVVPRAPDDRTLAAWIAAHADAQGQPTTSSLRGVGPHAKRLLGSGGVLCESLGVELRPGEIARAMRRDELHPDVHALFARIEALRDAMPVPESQDDVESFVPDTSAD
jgi:hypothetical protein